MPGTVSATGGHQGIQKIDYGFFALTDDRCIGAGFFEKILGFGGGAVPAEDIKRPFFGRVYGSRQTEKLAVLVISGNDSDTHDVEVVAVKGFCQVSIGVMMDILIIYDYLVAAPTQHGRDVGYPLGETNG